MINSCKILVLLSFLFYQDIVAQITNEKEYVVITFERAENKVHRLKRYYWIIPSDSIRSKNLLMASLYMETYFDKSEFEECCRGGTIDVLESSGNDTVSFSNDYNIALKQLNELVFKNRKRVQTIIHQWYNPKYEEITQVYATPIIVSFCYCMQKFSHLIKNYFQEGIVFLPLSSFRYNDNFWKSDKSKAIECFDYSSLKYVNTH